MRPVRRGRRTLWLKSGGSSCWVRVLVLRACVVPCVLPNLLSRRKTWTRLTQRLSILTPALPFIVGRYHRTPSPLPQNAHKKPMPSSPAVSLISLVSVPYISIETDRGVPATGKSHSRLGYTSYLVCEPPFLW